MNERVKSAFETFLNQPDKEINLAEAALLIAKFEYPELDITTYLAQIDLIADEIRERLPENPAASDILTQLNQVLFIEEGFEGNSDHYYDPRNSFLNDVIDRKLGIPISLSILYIELGNLLGLPLSGVSFPGHFLVKLEINDGAIVLDPYFGGISLSEEDLNDRLHEFYGDKLKKHHTAGLLASTPNREIVMRILRNLRNLYMHNKDWIKALDMADFMVKLDQDTADAIKARGSIYDKLECHQPALNDYKRYIKIQPRASDMELIRERVIFLSEQCRHIC